MKSDTTSSFEYRLDQWISKQGLLFLMFNGRGKGSLVMKLVSLLLRLVILAVIALVITWFYVKGKTETDTFKADVEQQLSNGLQSENLEISAISRINGGILSGDMFIKQLKLGESSNTFFTNWNVSDYEVNADGSRTDLEIENVSTLSGVTLSPLNLGDNYLSGWSARNVKVNSMEISLKTGADTDEQARETYATLFKKYETLNLQSIKVLDGTIFWGASRETIGAIEGAQIDILKKADSWEIEITGGTFSYEWIEKAKIAKMRVICRADGNVDIEYAFLQIGEGGLKLVGTIEVLAQPKVSGNYEFVRISVLDLIGAQYEPWLGGKIKGSGSFQGTLNSSQGITHDTIVNLEADARESDPESDSVIIIKGNKFELLDVVQSIDLLNSYTNIRAWDGTVELKYNTLAGLADISLNEVRCGVQGLLLMNGEFQSAKNQDIPVSADEVRSDIGNFTGEITIGFLPQVFKSAPSIIEAYKTDDVVLRTQLTVDMEGEIYGLTSKAGESLYKEAQREQK